MAVCRSRTNFTEKHICAGMRCQHELEWNHWEAAVQPTKISAGFMWHQSRKHPLSKFERNFESLHGKLTSDAPFLEGRSRALFRPSVTNHSDSQTSRPNSAAKFPATAGSSASSACCASAASVNGSALPSLHGGTALLCELGTALRSQDRHRVARNPSGPWQEFLRLQALSQSAGE